MTDPQRDMITSNKNTESDKSEENKANTTLKNEKDLIPECTALLSLYPDLALYSEETIPLYSNNFKNEMKENYKKACNLFYSSSKISTFYPSYREDLKIDLLKVFVLTVQENSSEFLQIFSEHPNEKAIEATVKESFALQHFLSIITQTNDIFHYNKTIFRVLSDAIHIIQQKTQKTNPKELSLIANYLFLNIFPLVYY